MRSQQELIHLTYQAACATWPWTGLSTVIFGMRSYSRFKVPKEALGWDDLIISFSWVGILHSMALEEFN